MFHEAIQKKNKSGPFLWTTVYVRNRQKNPLSSKFSDQYYH